MKKMAAEEQWLIVRRQNEKARNIYLHWKVMQVDLLPGNLVSKEMNRRWHLFDPYLPLFAPYGVTESFLMNGAGADVDPLNDSTGALAAELIPDSQRYFDYHHAASDVFEKVNKRELELGAINMAALIYLVDKYGL